MRKSMLATLTLLLFAASAYAGSCADCKTTYNEHYTACRGDTICQQRAYEAFKACQIGCN